MKVAAIIVNYNEQDCTYKFVQELTKYEVINRIVVVDNLSTTIGAFENLKKLENDKVKVITSDKNGGYDYGNNYGIKYLENLNEKYDYYIISNPDIEVEEKAIIKSLEYLEKNENYAVAAPRMYNKDNNPIRRSAWKLRSAKLDFIHSTRFLEILFYKKLRNGEYLFSDFENEILEVEAISGAFFIIKSDVLHKIGLLDENVFLFYEEDILANKIKDLNLKIVSVNSEKFIHYESQTIGKTLSYYNKVKQLFVSKMYYQIKYNKINKFQIGLFYFLYFIRKIELLFEIPVRKILHK